MQQKQKRNYLMTNQTKTDHFFLLLPSSIIFFLQKYKVNHVIFDIMLYLSNGKISHLSFEKKKTLHNFSNTRIRKRV
jgi:hypothetical protein